MNTAAAFRLTLSLAALGAGLPLAALTDDEALRPVAYLNGVNQDNLGAETAELARSIRRLMDELKRNGFPEQSLAGLKQLIEQLNALGVADMSKLGEQLRSLGSDTSLDPSKTISEVYVAQQAIEARLKALANKIALRQLREDTVRRLEALIARQLAAQRETRAIAGRATGVDRRRQLLVSDQRGVGEDLDAFVQSGETLLSALRENVQGATGQAADPAEPGFAERINAPLLKTYAGEALSLVEAAGYPEAFARQNALLAELNKILQGVLSSQSKEQRLSSALMQVSALRQEQQAREEGRQQSDAESVQSAADKAKVLAAKLATVDEEAAKAVAEAQAKLEAQAAARKESENAPQPANADQAQADRKQPGPDEVGQALAKAEESLRDKLSAAQTEENARNDHWNTAQNQNPNQARNQPADPSAPMAPRGDPRNDNDGGGDGMIANATDGYAGAAQSVGALSRDEREAMVGLQNERYPAEYAPWVQQYWRNLARDQ